MYFNRITTTYRKKHATVREVLNKTKAEAKTHRKELEEKRMLRGQIKTVLEEAAVALKEALRVRVNMKIRYHSVLPRSK